MKIAEEKSNWECVSKELLDQKELKLGKPFPDNFFYNPEKILYQQTYYKFAAKMIGKNKKVLHIGCSDGLGTYLVAKECGYAKGIDLNEAAIKLAINNFTSPIVDYFHDDFLHSTNVDFDAAVSFNVLENFPNEKLGLFWRKLTSSIQLNGIVIVGIANTTDNSSRFEMVKKEIKQYFRQIFLFSANNEVIHCGYQLNADYFLALGCQKK